MISEFKQTVVLQVVHSIDEEPIANAKFTFLSESTTEQRAACWRLRDATSEADDTSVVYIEQIEHEGYPVVVVYGDINPTGHPAGKILRVFFIRWPTTDPPVEGLENIACENEAEMVHRVLSYVSSSLSDKTRRIKLKPQVAV